jgi:hypothetical protein
LRSIAVVLVTEGLPFVRDPVTCKQEIDMRFSTLREPTALLMLVVTGQLRPINEVLQAARAILAQVLHVDA